MRSRHLLNLRLVLICGRLSLWTSNRRRSIRFLLRGNGNRSSSLVARRKKRGGIKIDPSPPPSSPSFYLLPVLRSIIKLFIGETADLTVSPSPSPFTNAIRLSLIFSVSEPRCSDSPRGLFDDQRRTKRGRKRLSLAEIIILERHAEMNARAHYRFILKYRFPNN